MDNLTCSVVEVRYRRCPLLLFCYLVLLDLIQTQPGSDRDTWQHGMGYSCVALPLDSTLTCAVINVVGAMHTRLRSSTVLVSSCSFISMFS